VPLQLDDYDVSILKSLLKDERKSFRAINLSINSEIPNPADFFSQRCLLKELALPF
jgi:hypothetical protein